MLARVAGVIGDIVKAPIKFLGNLIAGVKGGILKFKDNIVDHLRKGLMSWLFGALAEAGVELPEKFDLKGIIKLLASLFGLTWTNIRNRIVKQVGETAMAAIEKGVEIFSVLRTQGVAGLWQMLMDKLGDIKEMILEQVKDFVITKIITAGITWLIGLLNPAAAFIKACKMIYDIVMFFVENGSRIMEFVNTVIDSVADIVKGNVSGVVNKINDVLGPDGADHHRLPGQPDRPRRDRPEDPRDRRDPAEAGQQGAGLRHQDRPEAGGPDHPRDQGDQREGQGQGRRGQGVGEGQGRGREEVGEVEDLRRRRQPRGQAEAAHEGYGYRCCRRQQVRGQHGRREDASADAGPDRETPRTGSTGARSTGPELGGSWRGPASEGDDEREDAGSRRSTSPRRRRPRC